MRKKAVIELLRASEDRVTALERTQRALVIKGEALSASEHRDIEKLEGKINDESDERNKLKRELEEIELMEAGAKARVAAASGGNRGGNSYGGSTSDFSNFGQFLQSVALAARPHGDVDRRLMNLSAGASEAVPSDGGFAVPQGFMGEIMRRVNDLGALASRCRKVPMSTNSIRIPFVDESSRATGSRFGGIRVYRANEGSTVTASKPKLDRMEVALEKLMGIGYATDELLSDAPLMGELMVQAFAEELTFVVDDEIYRGDGAGKCLGILNSPALITVDKESGQAADTLVLANLTKMWSRCWGRSRKNAVWFINQDIEPQLFTLSQIVGSQGFPVFLPSGGISSEPYASLFGRPIIPIEQASTIGDVGDVILADMSQYMLFERAGGAKFDQSMHVRFLYDEMTFRVTWRVNGQPSWKSPLTPANGTNTLSPFVALQAR